MDLKEFVAETLRQIMDGVAEAKKYGSQIGGNVNPPDKTGACESEALFVKTKYGYVYAQNVTFDVAVTTTGQSQNEGEPKLAVAVSSDGGGQESEPRATSISRVRFTVPACLP